MLIYSKKNKKKVIASIYHYKNHENDRLDLSPKNEFIQTAIVNKNKNFYLNPHRHLRIMRKSNTTQEVWIIIQGKIEVTFYDIDKNLLTKKILKKNDISILFRGGHSMKILSKKIKIYEIKNGPYYGKKKDTQYI